MEAFTVIVFIILCGLLLYIIFRKRVNTTNTISNVNSTEYEHQVQSEAQMFCDAVYANQAICEIEADIILKKGESAYLQEQATMLENRSVSYSTRGGGAVRVAKGVYIGGSQGRSRTEQELRELDRGTLVMTSRRLVFTGNSIAKTIDMRKIMKIDLIPGGIRISIEGKEKQTTFKGLNHPSIWLSVWRLVLEKEELGEYPKIEVC